MAANAVKLRNHLRRMSQPDLHASNLFETVKEEVLVVPQVFDRLNRITEK